MWGLDVPTLVGLRFTTLLCWRSIPLTSGTVGPSSVRLVSGARSTGSSWEPRSTPHRGDPTLTYRLMREQQQQQQRLWRGGGDDGHQFIPLHRPPHTVIPGPQQRGGGPGGRRAVIGKWRVQSHWGAASEACVVWGRPPQPQNPPRTLLYIRYNDPSASQRDGWTGGGWMFQGGRSETCHVYSGGLVLWAPDGPKAPHVGRREQTSIVFN